MSAKGILLSRRDAFKKSAGGVAAGIIAFTGLEQLCAAAEAALSGDQMQYDFLLPRVKFECDTGVVDKWNITPSGDRYLLEELEKVVRCKVKIPQNCTFTSPYYGNEEHFNAVVTLDDFEKMRQFPFLFMTSEGHYNLARDEKANVKKYLEEGGFLLMDDCILQISSDYFYQSSVRILNNIFGAGSVVKIPRDHEVFHNVYDMGAIGLPHVSGTNHGGRGVMLGERLAVFLSSTDIHCGWTDRPGQWYGKSARSPHAYKEAIQIGINIIMYALSH